MFVIPCMHDLEIPALIPLPQVIQSFQHVLISPSWGQLLAAGQVLSSLSSLVPRPRSGMLALSLERFQFSQSSGRSCLPEQLQSFLLVTSFALSTLSGAQKVGNLSHLFLRSPPCKEKMPGFCGRSISLNAGGTFAHLMCVTNIKDPGNALCL